MRWRATVRAIAAGWRSPRSSSRRRSSSVAWRPAHPPKSIAEAARLAGCATLWESGMAARPRGETTVEELRRVAAEPVRVVTERTRSRPRPRLRPAPSRDRPPLRAHRVARRRRPAPSPRALYDQLVGGGRVARRAGAGRRASRMPTRRRLDELDAVVAAARGAARAVEPSLDPRRLARDRPASPAAGRNAGPRRGPRDARAATAGSCSPPSSPCCAGDHASDFGAVIPRYAGARSQRGRRPHPPMRWRPKSAWPAPASPDALAPVVSVAGAPMRWRADFTTETTARSSGGAAGCARDTASSPRGRPSRSRTVPACSARRVGSRRRSPSVRRRRTRGAWRSRAAAPRSRARSRAARRSCSVELPPSVPGAALSRQRAVGLEEVIGHRDLHRGSASSAGRTGALSALGASTNICARSPSGQTRLPPRFLPAHAMATTNVGTIDVYLISPRANGWRILTLQRARHHALPARVGDGARAHRGRARSPERPPCARCARRPGWR